MGFVSPSHSPQKLDAITVAFLPEQYAEWNAWLADYVAKNPDAQAADARKSYIGKAPKPATVRVQIPRLRKTK